MRNRTFILAAAAALVLSLHLSAVAQTPPASRCRVDLMNGQAVEGDVKELPDGSYEVKTRFGVVVTVRKSEVRGIRPLEEATAPGKSGTPPVGRTASTLRREISDAEIAAVVAGIVATPDETLAGADRDEMLADLPVDQESLDDMKRIAGPEAKVLLKPHFVMVYTSSTDAAQKLGARLEAIYRWKIQFMNMIQRPVIKPASKLEIYYFGTHKEFQNISGADLGIAGFYRPDDRRSYFFDFETHPALANVVKEAKDPNTPWQRRQRLRNRIRRFCENQNLEVIQHEAGHHIDFNIGLFPNNGLRRKASIPLWLVEGTTMMFEVPPSSAGASLGVLNHLRLNEVRTIWGKHPLSVTEWKRFIIDNGMWQNPPGGRGTAASYCLGWSLVYYLWREHRAGYGQYCKAVYDREEDVEMSNSEREKEFEDIFGRVDEAWIKDFYKFLDSLQLKRSLLPLGDQQSERDSGGNRGRGGGGGGRGRGGRGGR
jgi:hypothetical protein